jgi:Uncharacterized protein conserved in bacteria (DUF2147)
MRIHLAVLTFMIVPALCMGAAPAHPAEPTAVGLWEQMNESTGKADGWFLVSEHDGLYDATLVKMFPKPGENPNPICTECPGAQKDAPWLGLTIVKSMQREGLDYENGTILDPRDGAEHYARMQLSPDGQTLTVRGYLGIDPLGGDEAWKRLPDAAFKQLAVRMGRLVSRWNLHSRAATRSTAVGQGIFIFAEENSVSLRKRGRRFAGSTVACCGSGGMISENLHRRPVGSYRQSTVP